MHNCSSSFQWWLDRHDINSSLDKGSCNRYKGEVEHLQRICKAVLDIIVLKVVMLLNCVIMTQQGTQPRPLDRKMTWKYARPPHSSAATTTYGISVKMVL